MRTLRGRFILSHLLPILVVVPLFGLGLIYLLETQLLLGDLSTDVSERASLIADAVNDQPGVWTDPNQAERFVTEMNFFLQGRILLLTPDGDLIATNDPDLQDVIGENIGDDLEQEGVNKALTGNSSVLVTYTVTRQRGEALIPIKNVNQELVGIVAVTETLEGVANQFGRLRWLVLIALGIEVLLAVIVALVLAERLSRPIRSVTEAVAEIAEGQRVEPIPVHGPVEVRQLAGSVNSLTKRLRSLEDTRRRLLANMVHEIGRPLGAIRAAIYTLRQGAAEDPVVLDELLAGIEDEIKRMEPLLDDLAQLHGQVLGTLELNRQPLNLSDWLPPVLLPWRAAALQKDQIWQADIPANLPTLNLDSGRMSQVIGNLLSNAVKYTPAGGAISVVAGARQSEVWILISDNGPGIIAAEQEKVFEPFFRSRQQHRFPQGLGLGLTIARDVVIAHGGRLELDSTPGEGSAFTVYLPINSNSQEQPARPR